MLTEAISDVLTRHPRLDVITLHLSNVWMLYSQTLSKGPVTDPFSTGLFYPSVLIPEVPRSCLPSRSDKHYPIWHIRAAKARVRLGLFLPLLVKIDAVFANDREARLVFDVEAGSADNGVDFAFDAITADHTVLDYLFDRCEVHIHILFLDSQYL